MIIDTHCHLDDDRYIDDIEEVIKNSKSGGVEKIIIPSADPKTLKRAIKLSQEFEDIYFAVGVHPYHADEFDLDVLKKEVSNPKCVAIGECGLDYYRLPKDESEVQEYKELQKKVFIAQILLAKEVKKPLIVHIRDSSADSLEILEKYAGEEGGVLHCYNADHQLLKLANKNFYFGIGGVLTFKNAKKLVEVYPQIPQDRLVAETDAPYLTPTPHRGKRNEPLYTKFVIEKMAELSEISIEEMESITTQNSIRLFNI